MNSYATLYFSPRRGEKRRDPPPALRATSPYGEETGGEGGRRFES
jgi:hypothetical protein